MDQSISREGLLGQFSVRGDPRSRRGRRYPLRGLVGMLILGALQGETSLRGMWMWACKHWESIRHPLGFVGNRQPPVYATVWYVVSALDSDALDKAIQDWTASWARGRVRTVSIDGKVLRGSRRTSPAQAALEVVTAAGQELKVVLGQQGVSDGGLVAAAVELLREVPLQGRLVTADAGLLCRPVADAIIEGGGDYLGLIKDNQSELKEALDEWVEPDVSPPGQRTST